MIQKGIYQEMDMNPISLEAVVGWGAAILASLFNYKMKSDVAQMQLDVNKQFEALRSEFGAVFLSIPLATEQRSSMERRLSCLEADYKNIRDRNHDIRKDIAPEFFRIGERLGTIEERSQTNHEIIKENIRRINALEHK